MIINTDVGILLVKQETVWKVSQKKERGKWAWIRRVWYVSTMCLWEYDMFKKCTYVSFHHTILIMSIWWSYLRKELKALNSPHMFNCKVFMDNENCFSTRGLNVSWAFDFSVRGKIQSYPI